MDSRPGHQDYYESEYGSIQSPNPSSFSQPKTQPSHATNASVKESKIDSPKIIDESGLKTSSNFLQLLLSHILCLHV